MKDRIAAALAVLAFAAPAAAQEAQGGVTATRRAAVEHELQEERAKAAVESRIVRGAPYSAEAVTETTQALADGNRISRKSVSRIYRDSEGRTRRETVGTNGQVGSVMISDPVSESQWVLMPEKRIAHRNGVIMASGSGGNVAVASVRAMEGGTVVATRSAEGVAVEAREIKVEDELKRRQEVEAAAAGGRGGATTTFTTRVAPVEMPTMMRVPGSSAVNKEDLGQQVVEGVMARGTRTTTTIPAGEIGNAKPIEIVSEQWFSDDLKVLVMTRHADPRTGETIYKLTNVSLAEPAKTMFEVPADYTVRESVIRRKPELEQ